MKKEPQSLAKQYAVTSLGGRYFTSRDLTVMFVIGAVTGFLISAITFLS